MPIYKKIDKFEYSFNIKDLNAPANFYYATFADIKNLAAQLAYYFSIIYKNFVFVDFYDKAFIDSAKALIKDIDEFTLFLKLIDIDIETFIKLMVHISPQVFTSNLVKFIQKNYLNIEPTGKKTIKNSK